MVLDQASLVSGSGSRQKGRTSLVDRTCSGTGYTSITGLVGWPLLANSWNFAFSAHSLNLSGFWALWFCQEHHDASLFIVLQPILKKMKTLMNNLELVNLILFYVSFPLCQRLRVSTWSWLEQTHLEPMTMDLHIIWSILHFLSWSPLLYDSIEIDTWKYITLHG
jgi:hypothetical protein